MKIAVIGGSPKGQISVTIQYVKYIEKLHTEHEFEYVYPGQKVRSIIDNAGKEKEVYQKISGADLVLWAFPLYYVNVHSNLKRFIEHSFAEHKDAFKGKYAAAVCTSILFYDHLAVNYIHAVSEDLGMKFVDALSMHAEALMKKDGQNRTKLFADALFHAVGSRAAVGRRYAELPVVSWDYKPGAVQNKLKTDKKILVVTDSEQGNTGKMIDAYKSAFSQEVEVVNLDKINIRGGCLGCLKCGADNICAYEGKDDFIEMFRNKVQKADILVWAGEIKDRYLSWQWKRFFDRSFFNTHQMVLHNKVFVFLLSGPLSACGNLKESMLTYTDMEGSKLAAFVSDECADSRRLDDLILSAAEQSVYAAEIGYNTVHTCRSAGGMKIFRDEMYAGLSIVFKGDHKVYKKTGVYDFPNRNPFRRIMIGLGMLITRIPKIKKFFYGNMPENMIRNLKKIPDQAAE